MKKISLIIFAFLMIAVACVDDFTDANPPPRLDAPNLRITASGETQRIVVTPIDRFQNAYQGYVAYGGEREFTVNVIDAPGLVDAISVVPSVPDFGSAVLNGATVTAIKGQAVGSFKFTFTPNAALPDMSDRNLNLVVTVSDSQQDQNGEGNPKITTLTLPVRMAQCLTQGLSGKYKVTEASGNLDGDVPYTLVDLVADAGADIEVLIEEVFPGRYTIDEVTGGIWPVYYPGRANPAVGVDLCATTVAGHEGNLEVGGLRKFTVNGTRNIDGTITITWSYVRIVGATPANPAKGTYTLTPF